MADFTIGDYAYTDFYDGTVSAQVVDKTKTSYSDIPSTVSYGGSTYTVVSVFTCFMDCTNLVTPPAMPSSVRDMSSCFYGCTSLKNPPVIPSTVISMNTCFYNCTSLETAPVLPSDITNLTGVFTNCTSLVTPPTIPSGVTWMRECFKGCSNLESPPNIPNGVSGNGLISCFDRCTSLTTAPTLPSGITSLESCFFRCETITTAPEIPSGVTSMRNCFYGCVNLQESPDIPSSVTNMVNCFRDCSNLTIGKISNGTTMMSNCFKGCTSLVTVPTIPVTVKLMDYCFDGCTSLTSVSILSNNVTNLQYCFNGCTSLTTAPAIPNSVTDMTNCFSECTNLVAAPQLPDGVVKLNRCFHKCTKLATAPVIPSSVRDMTWCFGVCKSLITPPVIPDGVVDMSYCFSFCSALTTAPEIPSSVTNLSLCFVECVSLSGDVLVNNNPNYYTGIFTSTTSPIRIVPQYSTISQEGIAKWTVIADAYDNVTIFVPSLSFQTLSTYRVDSSGSTIIAEEGSYVLLEAVYAFVGLTGDVVTKVVKSNGATISPTWSETTTDGVTTARAWVHQDVDDQAIYAVTLSDIYNHAETRSFTVTRVEALLDFLNGNQGMGLAIGTIATQPGFHCALKSQFEDDLVAPDMTSEELSEFIEDLNPGGAQPSVIRTIHTEVVTASINIAFANHVTVTAPAVENYRFLCWSEVSTRGWVGSVYPEYTTRQTTTMWNATSGQSGTGTIDCTALYIPLYYATATSEADKVDFIVEQGTSDIWTYRKWDSGIAECWGEYPLAYTSFLAWGSALYYTQPYRSLSFPSGLFVDIPVVNGARVRGVEGWFGVESINKDTLNNLYMMRPTSVGAGTTNIGIIAKGRWK